MMTHKAMVAKMLKQPVVKAEYDAQAEEFALLDALLKARRQVGLTQAEIVVRMDTGFLPWHGESHRRRQPTVGVFDGNGER